LRHFVIPDCQVKPGIDNSYLSTIGNYIVDKQPETIICLGDFADMPSLSSYDVGKKSFEGKRYKNDVLAARAGIATLMSPIIQYQNQQKVNKKKPYTPKLIMLLGNHENRIDRAVNNDSKLEGILSTDDLGYRQKGWAVFPFLEVVVLDGVAYSHYFTSGSLGRPCASAAMMLSKKHQSCIAGHQQGLQIATGHAADGRRLTAIIAGSAYEHDEDYLGPQGNKHWRGCLMLHSVANGEFDLVPVPLKYLKDKYD
jgi:hypothetical protein